jgi:hypothetical protein
MLAHSPPFPLIIDLDDPHRDLTTEDEEGMTLALQHRDRVRCIHLEIPVPSLQKLLKAIDDEFPMLEYMHIAPPTEHNTRLILPPTFGAPHLRHFVLYHFASPIGSPLLTTAIGLVTLLLRWIHPFTYPHPNHLLEALSHLPQLETLQIGFRSPIPSTYIKRELLRRRVVIHATLPSLHWFSFAGVSVYLEAILPHMTTPLLETLKIHFFHQLSYAVPRLLQFITITNGLKFGNARFCFRDGGVAVWVFPHSEITVFSFYIHILCKPLDWQISSMAQIFNVLEPAFSTVMELTLDYADLSPSSEWHNQQVDCALWQKLLGSFRNVKTLRVHEGLVGDLSRSLQSDEEPPLKLLPKLEVLVHPEGSHNDEKFAPFIHERLLARQPIDLNSSTFPVGRVHYIVQSPAGVSHIRPHHVALP